MSFKHKITAGLVTTAFLSGTLVASTPSAHAAGENPYADATLTKVADGTDQGTVNGTFINEDNGYVPGDNTPTDGVVSSNDVVVYDFSVKINPGPQRDVEVSLEIPEFLSFSTADNPEICVTNQFVSGEFNGSSSAPGCVYHAKRGTPATIDISLILRAKDSFGEAVDGQVAKVKIGSGGQVWATNAAEPVTVVSAPTADLVVRPSQCPVSSPCFTSRTDTKTGYFDLIPTQVRFGGYNTLKGSSVGGPWSGKVDVSQFPAGTSWTLDGVPSAVSDGFVAVPSTQGSTRLAFTLPADFGSDWEPGQSDRFVIHAILDPMPFSTESFENFGTGWQPGSGEPSSFSTDNLKDTGSLAGFRIPNNDFGTWNVYKVAPPVPGQIFGKLLERPWVSTATYWEPGRMSFEDGLATNVDAYPTDVKYVAEDTELLATLGIYTDNVDVDSSYVVSDEWDPALQFATGPPEVLDQSGKPMPGDKYYVQWSTTNTQNTLQAEMTDPSLDSGWITSLQPVPEARSIRVVFSELPAKSGSYKVLIPMRVVSDWGDAGDKATPIMDTLQGRILVSGKLVSATRVVIPVVQTPPEAHLVAEAGQSAINPDTRKSSWVFTPSIRNLVSSTAPVSGDVTLAIDPCATTFDLQSDSQWSISEAFVKGSGCGTEDAIPGHVTLSISNPDGVVPTFQLSTGTLPPVSFSSDISALAGGLITMSGDFTMTKAGLQEPVATPAVASENSTIVPITVTAEQLRTLTPKVEVGDPITWRALVSAMSNGENNAGLKSETVIVLPGRGNDAQYLDDLDNGSVYDGIQTSDFQGTYLLDSAVVLPDDSDAGAEIWCSRDLSPSLTPSENTWSRDCEDSLSDPVTAIKVANPNPVSGIVTVDVAIAPTDNRAGDQYLLWIGAVDVDGVPLAQAWPTEAEVVASTISGVVYWDITGKGSDYKSGYPVQEGVNVSLLDALGKSIAETITDSEGRFLFENLHSGDYKVRLPEIGELGGMPATVPSTYYSGRTINVSQTFSYRGQRLSNASSESSQVRLGTDTAFKNVNFGFTAPDPYSDLMKNASEVKCGWDDVTCDVQWDITVKNGGTSFDPKTIQGAIGRGSYGIWTDTSYFIYRPYEPVFEISDIGQIRGVIQNNEVVRYSASGSGISYIYTSSDLYRVSASDLYSSGFSVSTKKIEGISGPIIGGLGTDLERSGQATVAAWSESSFYLLSDLNADHIPEVTGDILQVSNGRFYDGQDVFFVVTSEGFWVVKADGSAITVDTQGQIVTTLPQGFPVDGWGWGQFWISTNDSVCLADTSGSVFTTRCLGNSQIPGVAGQLGGDLVTQGASFWNGTEYYGIHSPELTPQKVQGISGSILGATGTAPGINGSAVWTTKGLFLVPSDVTTGDPSVALSRTIEVPGIYGEIVGAIGDSPTVAGGGSAVWTDSAYWIVDNEGTPKEVTGITGTILGAIGPNPMEISGVWTSEGFYLVYGGGTANKVDIPLPEVPEFTGTPVTLTGGKLVDSTSSEVFDVEAIIGERILGMVGVSPANDGTGVWTSDGYHIVKSDGTSTKATGITGTVLGATGDYPGYSYGGSGVWTPDGYYIVKSDGTSSKATGITGTVLGAIGDYPAAPYEGMGSGVWTTDGYFIVEWNGTSIKSTGVTGDVIDAIGDFPMSGSGVRTTDGYFLVGPDGTAKKATGVTGEVLGVSGEDAGSGVWTTDGYFIVSSTGVATKATGITGNVLGATGNQPAQYNGGSGVWTTDGYFIVSSTGVATKATGITGNVLGATGRFPAKISSGSGVWTTDGYYVVNGHGIATKASGVTGSVLGAIGYNPALNGYGSGVWTTDGYFIVLSSGMATKATGITGNVLGVTGAEPAGNPGSGAWTTDGYYIVRSNGTAVMADVAQHRITLPPLTQTHSGDFVTRDYQLPDLAPGEKVTVTLSGKVNRPSYEATGGVGLVIGNQAWEVFSQTPRDVPTLPQPNLPSYDTHSPYAFGKWTGNNTCTATPGWVVPGDQCDQVWAQVEPTSQRLGSLSGYLWVDSEGDLSLSQASQRVAGARVSLYRADDFTVMGTALTDDQGFYQFNNLVPEDDYYVAFTVGKDPVDGAGQPIVGPGQSWGWTPEAVADGPVPDRAMTDAAGITTPVVAVVADGITENVNGAVRVYQVGATVTKESQDPNTGLWQTSPLVVEHDQEVQVRASFTNTGSDSLKDLVFVDTTAAGPEVAWESCIFGSATADISGGTIKDGVFTGALPTDWVLPAGGPAEQRTYTCTGFIAPLGDSAEETRTHEDTVTPYAVGVITGIRVDGESSIEVTSNPRVRPVPQISLEKGVLDKDSGTITSEITTTAGTKNTVTFRMRNIGEEPLLDMSLSDKTTVGEAVVDNITCKYQQQTINGRIRTYLGVGETAMCTGELVIEQMPAEHENQARVWAVGIDSGRLTHADATFTASVPFDPDIRLPDSGGIGDWVYLSVAAGLAVVGAAYLLWRRFGGCSV